MSADSSAAGDRRLPRRSWQGLWRGPFLALALLLIVVLIAGGASRADALGQAVVRGAACLALLAVALAYDRPADRRIGAVGWFLGAAVLLVAIQLVPLPMSFWTALPGRTPFVQALPGEAVWRPLAIVPGAAINTLLSLSVPVAIWLLARRIDNDGYDRLAGLILALVGTSTFLGIVQFSGSGTDNPFVNEALDISGSFANRNHFALFLAIGCLIAPCWAFRLDDRLSWRVPVGGGLMLLFLLMILASGSRAGILLGGLGSIFGAIIAWTARGRRRKALKRSHVVLGAIAAVGIVAGLVTVSVQADRARSVTRAMSLQVDEDMRVRAAPLVVDMTRSYFPTGAGFGGFDPLFRMRETFDLLKSTYFNRAHNDLLEVILEGGAAALILLLAAIGWWAVATRQAWRQSMSHRVAEARLGSATLLLVFLSSVVDYPVRTPMMAAIVVLAALWLQRGTASGQSALPRQGRHL